jgi:transposase
VPIRKISRRTGVSRNTIRKYLRSELIEPKVRVPDRPSKLDLNVAVSAQGHI